jgi:hypothetical protein
VSTTVFHQRAAGWSLPVYHDVIMADDAAIDF